ncbi:Concanavalin A-like lectin/glucanases superfamily [uncultured Caudovirales phage]|uniref:Concanavalin A-like lectin/glucanases superfamily n=1 Tax=uncultured Caudovirales phage TaxID=2100421 RepID=A0A6J7WFD7_9CAUD|nr:Concanavalin A-like lectin/glucanases superfamily [uncultured Caudovirales phage]
MQRYKGNVRSATAPVTSLGGASGIWTPTEAMQAKQASAWPSAGTGGSIALNGSSQYLTAASAQSPPTLGTAIFTIEAFVKFAALPANGSFANICNQGNGTDFRFFLNGSATAGQGFLTAWQGASTKWQTVASGIVIDTWYHICVMRSSSTVLDIYVNGTKLSKTTDTTTLVTYTATGMYVGGESGNYRVNGNITNFRYVNGTAVYNVNGFTPPTSPLTNITNTKLLLLANDSGTFTNDSSTANSGGPYTVTNVGGATFSVTTPFA